MRHRLHREPSWTRSRSSSWGFLHNASQLYFDFSQKSCSALFCSSIRRHSSVPRFRGPTQTRTRVCLLSAPRPRLGFVFHLLYIPIDSGEFVCWFACSFDCLFVCSGRFASLFVCFIQYTDRDSGSFIYYQVYSYSICCRNRSDLSSSGHHRMWRPTNPRRSSRTAPSLPAGTRSLFKNTRARCASAYLSAARPQSRCFKARLSHHHLLWAESTPRRLGL